ncbi:MAG: aldehyde ferredoxin oxidoreductase [Myxococcales bacterium]|nr:aldehyde ferredoxin oxidoreductase [Myxococcales bacterium]
MTAYDRLFARLAPESQYPTQGATAFIDLERRTVRKGYTPRAVVETFLEGRGGNMFYLYNLLDPTAPGGPLDPQNPLIFGQGVLTGIVPSAARGNCTGWSPESYILLDTNCGDYFPSFCKLSGWDRLVLHGRAADWTYLHIERDQIEFRDATPWVGLDNIDLRERVERDLGGKWARDLAMASITSAGERGVLSAGIMGGPKAIYARGGTGAKMGSLNLKAIVVRGFDPKLGFGADPAAVKPYNREIAKQVLGTAVVKHALKVRGTPFLYKPSRLLGAMGTKNNQETTWTDALDAERIDPYRNDMAGCFRCPVNCRPMNDLGADGKGDRYDSGDGPEYVTVGKFGPMIGLTDVKQLIRLNNIANDLGLDTASAGSSISWAMELYQRGIIGPTETGGLELTWGNYEVVEKLLFMTARREGFGDTLAWSARAVEAGKYPKEALEYRIAVKGLMQSDPHDARIIKAFALGLAVATRGMDHLRNRVTLEINAKINDDPAFKRALYGGDVAAEPQSYVGKEIAVRRCEDVYAVGDSVGMCRFTTQLFNSPSLPGLVQFSAQVANVTGLTLSPVELERVGLSITGLERMINYALGMRRADDTLPRRWFEEELVWGAYQGEKIDRAEFDALLTRFYQVSQLDDEGRPAVDFRARLAEVALGFAVRVLVPDSLHALPGGGLVVTERVSNLRELVAAINRVVPGLGDKLDTDGFNFVVNDEVVLHGRGDTKVASGDRVELVMAMAGG